MSKADLFDEEEGMARMTFGEHLEDLRRRLIWALIGVVPCIIIGLFIGGWLVEKMSDPVRRALTQYYDRRRTENLDALAKARTEGLPTKREQILLYVDRAVLRDAVKQTFPELELQALPEAPAGAGSQIRLQVEVDHDELQEKARDEYNRNALMTLGPQEGFMAYLKVSIVAGIVIGSWWIIYHLWQFVAEGLYRHERRIVYRAMPFSVGLFLTGVLFCFFVVLPVVLNFFFGINEWLRIEPNVRLSEWLGFATILPLIFGICFELPLVMLVLESVGIFRLDDYISRWRHAILIIAIVAMIVTPTTDPGSMMLLMGPMGGLYFLGIGLVQMRRGGLRAISPVAKLRGVVAALVTLYVIGLSIGFAFPTGWLEENWWYDTIWKPGAWPTSWMFRSRLEQPATNWIWGVTIGNAVLIGLVLLRAGELILRLVRR